jgi:hypothetical protein
MKKSDMKKALGRAPWQQRHKRRILPDSVAFQPVASSLRPAEKPGHRSDIQMVMAEGLWRLSRQATLQDRYQFIELLNQRRVSIDIDNINTVLLTHHGL